MPRPLMDPDPTCAARRRRPDLVELSLQTPVRVARAVLAAAGSEAAVVIDQDRPVGVVTGAALAGHRGTLPAPNTPIGDVMDLEVVSIEPDADEHETLVAYQDAAWRSLLRRHPLRRYDRDGVAGRG
jgi:CBS domain-containing protein